METVRRQQLCADLSHIQIFVNNLTLIIVNHFPQFFKINLKYSLMFSSVLVVTVLFKNSTNEDVSVIGMPIWDDIGNYKSIHGPWYEQKSQC